METRKVNWKNIKIMGIITTIGILIGFIDRVVNGIRPIEDFYMFLTSFVNSPQHEIAESWYYTNEAISSSASSGFNLFGLLVLVIVGAGVVSLVATSFSYAGGME